MYVIPRVSEISQEAGLKVIILFSYFSICSHVQYESSKDHDVVSCYRVPHIYSLNHFHEEADTLLKRMV